MNIFVLDDNELESAKFHVDRHIVKMPLETAQILCSVRHLNGDKTRIPYKLTHKNHPCVKWAAESDSNYLWLIKFGIALCGEYTTRYGKRHACRNVICDCRDAYYNGNVTFTNLIETPFAQAMPQQYQNINPVEAYRNYYMGEKRHLASWKSRETPYWWK